MNPKIIDYDFYELSKKYRKDYLYGEISGAEIAKLEGFPVHKLKYILPVWLEEEREIERTKKRIETEARLKNLKAGGSQILKDLDIEKYEDYKAPLIIADCEGLSKKEIQKLVDETL